jgi:hypothetical protein
MNLIVAIIGFILSGMIGWNILSSGLTNVMFFLLTDIGINMLLFPLLAKFIPKLCQNNVGQILEVLTKLGFFFLTKKKTPKLYMYIAGYSGAKIILRFITSLLFCEQETEEKVEESVEEPVEEESVEEPVEEESVEEPVEEESVEESVEEASVSLEDDSEEKKAAKKAAKIAAKKAAKKEEDPVAEGFSF